MATEEQPPAGERPDELAATLREARREVERLVQELDGGAVALAPETSGLFRSVGRILADMEGSPPAASAAPDAGAGMFVDVSDLLGYFPHNRLPTGVQRVQMSTIRALLDGPDGSLITLCRFVEGRDVWLRVPVEPFRALCAMSIVGGDPTDPVWRAEVAALDSRIASGAPLRFSMGACLVNVGTSWWLPNYFLYIREEKRRSGLIYIPLIHDLIPVLLPAYCNPELVQEFIDWFIGVLRHADYFLAVSDSTKADLITLAAELGREIRPDLVQVVPLASEPNDAAIREEAGRTSLARWGLESKPFVLFVSTIEARKNQAGAIEAWHQLILRHGKDKVPQLVLVGKRGFASDRALDRVALNPDLSDCVTVLHSATDPELEALYRRCLFTIYPSFYEGWGLPVTESLLHGKVPLTSSVSSLPQAGGGLSVMYDVGSGAALLEALESLIFDPARRERLERRIAESFVVRSWRDFADDIRGAVMRWCPAAGERPLLWQASTIQPGYYPLTRNREMRLSGLLDSAEVFRQGGWWRLEDFGCWTKPRGGEIMIRPRALPTRIALELVPLGGDPTPYRIDVPQAGAAISGALHGNAHKWVFLDLPAGEEGEVRIRIQSLRTAIAVDPVTRETRELGVGVGGFFLFGEDSDLARFEFVEAVVLGSIRDHLFGRAG